MKKIIVVALAVITETTMAPGASAATCERLPSAAFKVSVREAPVIVREDFSLSELNEMSAQLRRPPAHPVYGFYAATVGYALPRMKIPGERPATGNRVCPQFSIAAELVAVDRRIEVAKDLSIVPCRLQAAIVHYQHHATAASLALHRFALELPRTLAPNIYRYMQDHPKSSQVSKVALKKYVENRLSHAVKAFSASLVEVQAEVDSSSEITTLLVPCDNT